MHARAIVAFLGLSAAALGCNGAPDPGGAGAGPGGDGGPLTRIEPGGPLPLSPGNLTGQDEDPTILRALDGSLFAAWYSNRNGTQEDGLEDKEVFLVRSTDALSWTDPPIQLTRSSAWAFYPSLTQDRSGAFHLAWWRVILLPPGCTPAVDCTGTDNRIVYKSSPDGIAWDLDAEVEITAGPGDWLPSIVHDRIGDRLLVYFAAVARDANGDVDLGEATTRIYVVIHEGGAWSPPARLSGVNPDTSHNTYPHVVQRDDGVFQMTWTRYDAGAGSDVLQVLEEPSTDTMFSTSTDGLTWSAPVVMSDGGAGPAIDVFPYLYADHAGARWYVTWRTTALGGAGGAAVELPVGAAYPGDLVERPEIAGYTGRVLATPTPDVFWAVWVRGPAPAQKVEHRFFAK
jgi:hypothetical protein